MAKKRKLETVGHREEIQEQLLNQIWEVVGLVGPHKHSVLVLLPSRRRESLEQAAGISRECRIKMWKTRGARKASSWEMK